MQLASFPGLIFCVRNETYEQTDVQKIKAWYLLQE